MSSRLIVSIVAILVFSSFVFAAETCELQMPKFKSKIDRLSPKQQKMLKPNDTYLSFFNSNQLPKADKLSKFYFLEDMQLPPENFTKEKIDSTRERLKQLFEHYVYGYAPPLPSYELNLVSDRSSVDIGNGVRARIKDFNIIPQIGNSSKPNPTIRFTLFLPENLPAGAKPPTFLAMNKCGNHKVSIPGSVEQRNLGYLPDDCKKPDYEKEHSETFWNVDYIVSQGYAFATMHESDISPDNKDKFNTRILSYYTEAKYKGEHGWRTIASWAWGLRLAAKVLREKTSEDVDTKKIITTGHSRRGKTALLAAAFDPEIAMAVPHQSGTLGLALVRNHTLASRCEYTEKAAFRLMPLVGSQQESITINDFLFDHWFSDYAEKFSWNESQMPVDQHLLLALMAPRPVLSTEGLQDEWANPDSAYTTLKLATPYYEYLGAKGLTQTRAFTKDEMQKYQVGQLSQLRLDTDHIMTLDYWKEILEFVKRK